MLTNSISCYKINQINRLYVDFISGYTEPNIQNLIYRTKYTEPNIQNQIYRTKYTEPNIQNQIYRTKYTEPNLQNQIYKTKYTKPNIQNQIYRTKFGEPDIQNQIYRTKNNFNIVFFFVDNFSFLIRGIKMSIKSKLFYNFLNLKKNIIWYFSVIKKY